MPYTFATLLVLILLPAPILLGWSWYRLFRLRPIDSEEKRFSRIALTTVTTVWPLVVVGVALAGTLNQLLVGTVALLAIFGAVVLAFFGEKQMFRPTIGACLVVGCHWLLTLQIIV